jgi:hypothetical protein
MLNLGGLKLDLADFTFKESKGDSFPSLGKSRSEGRVGQIIEICQNLGENLNPGPDCLARATIETALVAPDTKLAPLVGGAT